MMQSAARRGEVRIMAASTAAWTCLLDEGHAAAVWQAAAWDALPAPVHCRCRQQPCLVLSTVISKISTDPAQQKTQNSPIMCSIMTECGADCCPLLRCLTMWCVRVWAWACDNVCATTCVCVCLYMRMCLVFLGCALIGDL
jgi:hypothetical protein